VGGSSGAVLAACGEFLEAEPKAERIVCLCADRGDNYQSSIFNDAWLRAHEIHLSADDLKPVQKIVPFDQHPGFNDVSAPAERGVCRDSEGALIGAGLVIADSERATARRQIQHLF